MQCPQCQHANPEDARFCNACGAKLDRPCAACGHVNPPGSRFCNACGQPLVAPVPHLTPSAQPATTAQERAGLSYTPQHLVDKILTSRSALGGGAQAGHRAVR
jgi:predicted amidophosphoribosyltransferase